MLNSDFFDNHKLYNGNIISYEKLCKDFLRSLRGKKSQRQLSEKLGYSFNQVGKWEAGFKQFKWSDFFSLCRALDIEWESSFRNLNWTFQGEFKPSSTFIELIRNDIEHFSRIGKKSSYLYDMNLDSIDPDFTDVLKVLDRLPSRLVSFISIFIEVENLTSLKKRYQEFKQSVDLVHKEPLCVLVNAALQVREYQNLNRHCEHVLAKHCQVDVKKLNYLLSLMTASGLIGFDGAKYIPAGFDFSFSGLRLAKLRPLTKYVTQLAAEKYPTEPRSSQDGTENKNPCVSSVRINALSNEAAKRVMDLVSAFHDQVTEVVKADQGKIKEEVQIILIHSFHSQV